MILEEEGYMGQRGTNREGLNAEGLIEEVN